jgi:hypothetical protein
VLTILIDEAYLISLQDHWRPFISIEGLVLLGTPHFRAGLAQWELITAKKLGIPCAESPRSQDWSDVRKHLISIAEVQEFRALGPGPGPTIACFYSSLPVPERNLISKIHTSKVLQAPQKNF